ncbi:MAG: CoA transferase [Acidimicrobiales bacterium]|nr:CoA transferase [Acidimicrobiales bacterium]
MNSIEEVLAHEQFHASQAVVRFPDEQGTRPMIAMPADFGGTPPVPPHRAPRVGEHMRDVLGVHELDPAAIERLLGDGVAVSPD